MVKRGSSLAALGAKRQKLADELAAVDQQQEDQEHDKVLNELLTVAIGNTALMKKLLSHAEVIQQGNVVDSKSFPKTYIYVSKIPKDFNLKQALPAMTSKLSAQQLVRACKLDKRADLKLAYLGAGMGPEQKIMDHEKEKYLDILKARTKVMRNPLDKVKFNPDGSIDWTTGGHWELIPAIPSGSDPAQHQYAEVRCRALEKDPKRSLPPAFCVTGDWVMKEPWRLTTKLETPSATKPQVRLKLADLFADHSGFKDLLEDLPVYGARQVKAKAKARGKKDEKEPEMTEEEKKKDKLSKALGRLKRQQQKSS